MTRVSLPDTLIFDSRRDSVAGWRSVQRSGWQVEDPVRTSAEALFEAFPEWRSLAKREVDGWGSEYVLVEVTPPSGANVDEGLWIDTSNDEITVGFDSFHNHFDDWTGESSPFGTGSALEFVQQIVAERVAIMTCWHDDRCVGGEVMNAGETIEPPTSTDTYDRIRVRSWNGTWNLDLDA
jgi:hypothetical protein